MAKSIQEQIADTEKKLKVLKKRKEEKKLREEIEEIQANNVSLKAAIMNLKKDINLNSFEASISDGRVIKCVSTEQVMSELNNIY